MGLQFHRPASARRPLSSATAPLRSAVPGPRRHGAEFLTELLDFEGTVELARALRTTPSVPRRAGSTAASDAVSVAERRLADAERLARRPIDDPQGIPLLSSDRMKRLLERAGAPAARRRKAITAAARELFAPVEARTLQRITSVRSLVRDVRHDLAPALVAAGPVAARLEQIDAALDRATSARSDVLVARAVAALGDAFADDVERAVLALPRPCDALPVEAWTGPGGLAVGHVARSEALVVAVYHHGRARVDMLVEAALGGRPR